MATSLNKKMGSHIEILEMPDCSEQAKAILKTYFNLWRRRVKIKKEKAENVKLKLEQREKLDNLMQTLKRYKKEKEAQQVEVEKLPVSVQPKKVSANFKNRFEAQKNAIEKLTMKLEEKDRLIDELKLGILNKEALRSISETKIEIREIFANCSAKVRCKVAPPPDYSEKFMISTQKAPKILQEMEAKALERAKKREIILERKRIIEENRKKMIAEALEKKRVQDEEEKKRNLQMIKERRRKELELEKIRQANKLIFLEKLNKAVALHNKNLLKKGFKSFLYNCVVNKNNFKRSELHCRIKILSKTINTWKEFIEDQYRDKNALADALCAQKLLSKTFNIWMELRMDRIRSTQVAEDFYDFILQNNTFVRWHRNVCIQIMQTEKQMKVARQHYNRKILFHYFYQWRSLPAVLQLEKAKEQKKKRWRQKVWEILPDYKPPLEDDYI